MLDTVLAIPFWLELVATISGATFGALSAVRERYDIFGVVCIAIITGLAGGIIRDILLQDYGIYAFQRPSLIIAAAAAAIVVFFFANLTEKLDPINYVADNLSLALFAVIGTGKALSAGLGPVPAVLLGTITAIGGGVVRDICMARKPWVFQANTLYSTAALIGCIAFAALKSYHLIDAYAGIACVTLVLAVRYTSLALGLKTKPAHDYSDALVGVVRRPVNRVRHARFFGAR